MKTIFFLPFFFLFFITLGCIHAQNTVSELNLDFEIVEYGIPKGWIIPPTQEVSLDAVNVKSGKFSVVINCMEDSVFMPIGFVLQNIYEGEKVTLTGYIKTESVIDGCAGLSINSFPTDDIIGVTGTTDWKKYELTVDFRQTNFILIGGFLKGKGKVWFDDFNLYIDGENIIDIIEPAPKDILSENEITALKKYIYPLRTYEPDGGDTKDLAILDQLIGGSKVVGLGEVTHGSSEIFKMKNRIIQYLAAYNGFNIFSLEANMPEAYRLNNYTVRGEGDPKKLIEDMYFWTWKTVEMLCLVEWMREFNQPKQRIEYTGFDMQYFEGAVYELINGFKGNKDVENKILFDLRINLEEIKTQYNQSQEFLFIDDSKMEEFNSIISLIQDNIATSPFSVSKKEWLHQNTVIIQQYLGDYRRNTINWRDKCMADNLMWIKNHHPSSKIIIWAHNEHIKKTNQMMGAYLSQQLEDDYTTFGFAFYDGSFTAMGRTDIAVQAYPGTIEYLLEQINEPIFILDLKKIKLDNLKETEWLTRRILMRRTGAKPGGYRHEFFQGKITEEHDYLIFIKTSSPSQPLWY